MVEILSVLAIMAMLVLVMLVGYKYAMTYYRATEILATANTEQISVRTQKVSYGTFTEIEGQIASRYNYAVRLLEGQETAEGDIGFIIAVYEVSADVCASVLSREWDAPDYYMVNDDILNLKEGLDKTACYGQADPQNITLAFVFGWAGLDETCDMSVPCTDDHGNPDQRTRVQLPDGKCQCKCSPPNDMYDGETGQCLCEGIKSEYNGTDCVCPASTTPVFANPDTCACPEGTDENNGGCCSSQYPIFYPEANQCGREFMNDENGTPHACTEAAPIGVDNGTEANCDDCPNRVLLHHDRGSPLVHGGATGNESRSFCVLPCPAGMFVGTNGTCVSCAENSVIAALNKTACDACASEAPWGAGDGNRYDTTGRWWRGYIQYCPFKCPDGYFFGAGGCSPCSMSNTINTAWWSYYTRSGADPYPQTFADLQDQCELACDGSSDARVRRRMIGLGGNVTYCILDDCPSDKPLRGTNGSCFPCTAQSVQLPVDIYGIPFAGFAESCSACKDENGNPTHKLIGSICSKADCPARSELSAGKCVCEAGYIMAGGQCKDCSDQNAMQITQAECEACNGLRTWVSHHKGYRCNKTRADDEFYSEQGTFNCANPGSFITYTKDYCQVCDGNNGRTRRVAVGGLNYYCAIPCGAGELMDNAARCYPCDISATVNVKAEDEDIYDNVYKTCWEQCPGQRHKGQGADCLKCAAGTYSRTKDVCEDCPIDVSALTAPGDCAACNGQWNGTSCIGCPANTYNKNGVCTACPEDPGDMTDWQYCKACNYDWNEQVNKCMPL